MLLASPGYDVGDVEVVAPVVLVHAPPLGSRGELRANSWRRGRHLGRWWGRGTRRGVGANWLVDKGTSWLDNALCSEMDANTDAMWGEIDHITNPTSQLVRLLSLQIDLLLGLKVAVKVV